MLKSIISWFSCNKQLRKELDDAQQRLMAQATRIEELKNKCSNTCKLNEELIAKTYKHNRLYTEQKDYIQHLEDELNNRPKSAPKKKEPNAKRTIKRSVLSSSKSSG